MMHRCYRKFNKHILGILLLLVVNVQGATLIQKQMCNYFYNLTTESLGYFAAGSGYWYQGATFGDSNEAIALCIFSVLGSIATAIAVVFYFGMWKTEDVYFAMPIWAINREIERLMIKAHHLHAQYLNDLNNHKSSKSCYN